MYIIDLFRTIIRKSNVTVIIYLVLNVLLVVGMFSAFADEPWKGALLGAGVYIVSLFIALSPVGEAILRIQTGCKKIKRQDVADRIYPLFNEVYVQAKKKDPSLRDDIQIYINPTKSVNAFATGRKTICATEGLLYLPKDQIKAVLAHEFGHISHKDTDLILLITVGNFIVTAIFLIFRIIVGILSTIGGVLGAAGHGIGTGLAVFLSGFLFDLIIAGTMWLWSKLGIVLVMKASRGNEFEADEFSSQLGYGNELAECLDNICDDDEAKGLFATLASSHPSKEDRIAHLNELGANYRADFEAADRERELEEKDVTAIETNESFPKYCVRCGSSINEEMEFCTECGTKIVHL